MSVDSVCPVANVLAVRAAHIFIYDIASLSNILKVPLIINKTLSLLCFILAITSAESQTKTFMHESENAIALKKCYESVL